MVAPKSLELNPATDAAAADPRPTPWARVHSALMPDYNGRATAYWWIVVLLGTSAVVASLMKLAGDSPRVRLEVVAGTAVAMLAGFFPVRIPRMKNSFAAGEVFIFLLLLMHGPGAAVLAAAGEAGVGSWRTSRRWTSRIASPAMAAVAMFCAGSPLDLLVDRLAPSAGALIVSAMASATAYFVINALLVTAVPRLKRREWLAGSDLFGVFGWVGIAYAGSAAVAALLFLVSRQSGVGVLMAMVPLLGMLLATLHYFFRQQEAAQVAIGREAQLAARHVRELEASERRFHSAFTHASIGMALLEIDGCVLQANPALRDLLGHAGAGLLGKRFQAHVHPEDQPAFDANLRAVEQPAFEGFVQELRCEHRDGAVVWVSAHCSFFSEPGASASCLILQVQDITARRRAEEELQRIAFNDSLTGLLNRRRFHELLGHAVERASVAGGEAFAVMFLDLDRFKLINDSLGHSAGDNFLVQVARCIQENLRPSDIVARLGGDEFAILVSQLEHGWLAVGLAERLMESLKRPFQVAGTQINTSASIGITFSAFGYACAEDVLRDADIAMYRAKAAGKARYALFDTSLHADVADRLRLEGDLRQAIDSGQLMVAYQPQFRLDDGRLSGFEALVRWAHPVEGAIGPGDFIPIAEEAGLMLRLTDFVLHSACRQLRAWQLADPALAALEMSINVSGNDLAHSGLVARVTHALVESGVRPEHLTLELTENILMSRLEGALPTLAELRHLGIRLALDDFGTGYSSLSHLSTLPINILKIDRSFVGGLVAGSDEAAVVRAILLLGQSLGKAVIAEGIETKAQRTLLQLMGCEFGQGFHLARPMTPEQVQGMLDRIGAEPAQSPAPPAPAAKPVHSAKEALLH